MKEIPLTRGLFALVDDADFEWLNTFKWHAHPYHMKTRCFCAATRLSAVKSKQLMHKLLCPGELVDHVDGNPLNNQRSNLRNCTPTQSSQNRRCRYDNATGYKGVTQCKGKIQARITFQGKRISVGYFRDPVSAARAYDEAAKKYFGGFARLNFPEPTNKNQQTKIQ